MKVGYYRHLVTSLTCFFLAFLVGCADEDTTNIDETGVDPQAQTTSVRYDDEDIAALLPGEFLRLNLTLPNTVYALTYTNPANLDRVLVISDNEKYVLGDRAPATVDTGCAVRRQIVLSGDLDGDIDVVQLQEPESCKCPCCLTVGGKLYCCES